MILFDTMRVCRAIKNIFITGHLDIGKTTLLQKVVAGIPGHVRCGGFVTGEIRRRGNRVGFEVCSLDGRRTILAHRDLRTRPRGGRYGVDVSGFKRFVLPLLEEGMIQVYLIDEIGKMECLSDTFCRKIEDLLDSDTPVLGSIAYKGKGFIRQVKMRRDVDSIELAPPNSAMLASFLIEKVMHLVMRHAMGSGSPIFTLQDCAPRCRRDRAGRSGEMKRSSTSFTAVWEF